MNTTKILNVKHLNSFKIRLIIPRQPESAEVLEEE